MPKRSEGCGFLPDVAENLRIVLATHDPETNAVTIHLECSSLELYGTIAISNVRAMVHPSTEVALKWEIQGR